MMRITEYNKKCKYNKKSYLKVIGTCNNFIINYLFSYFFIIKDSNYH